MLSEEVLERNVAGIRATLQRLISDASGAGPAPVILNNLVLVLCQGPVPAACCTFQ